MDKKLVAGLSLSIVLFMYPLCANAGDLYTVDENGNWVMNPQVTTPTVTQPANSTAKKSSYSYSYSVQKPAVTNTSSPQEQNKNANEPYITLPDEQNNNPYNVKAEKVQKEPFNPNQSTAELKNIVTEIGYNILDKNEIDKNVSFVLDTNSRVNATTGITNKITVYKGLIDYCEDEDELAFVIGHEIGHAASNHVLKTVGTNTATGVVTSMAEYSVDQAIDNRWARWGAKIAIGQAGNAVKNKMQRGRETDADLLSIDYVVAAGYNPLAGISIMNKIGENYADFWSDHPSTDKRVVSMYNYIKRKYPEYLKEGYNTDSYKQAVSRYVR